MGLEKEDIMALIAILQKGLTDDEEELQYTEAPKPKSKPKKEQNKRVNKFDSMGEKNMHKSDSKIDQLLWGKNEPSMRARESTITQARCRVCGKTEEVSSSLVESHERYKCNKCAGSAG